MTATASVTQGPSTGEDYGLDLVAQHNAVTSTEQFPPYEEHAKGLGVYVSTPFVGLSCILVLTSFTE
jgi:hypothetical protein